ncbi:MAG: MOSC domain-containing protein [Bradymonadia bacterium]
MIPIDAHRLNEWACRPYPPSGRIPDADAHLSTEAVAQLSPSLLSQQPNRLSGIVVRYADGTRGQPTEANVTVEEGILGDRWATGKRDVGNQISAMNTMVAYTIANGQSVVLSGDNLFVDFDLSETALPVGSQLAIGTVHLEVSAEPHTPCLKFKARFGEPAFRHAAQNLRIRGVLLTVVKSGGFGVGDEIRVISKTSD